MRKKFSLGNIVKVGKIVKEAGKKINAIITRGA